MLYFGAQQQSAQESLLGCGYVLMEKWRGSACARQRGPHTLWSVTGCGRGAAFWQWYFALGASGGATRRALPAHAAQLQQADTCSQQLGEQQHWPAGARTGTSTASVAGPGQRPTGQCISTCSVSGRARDRQRSSTWPTPLHRLASPAQAFTCSSTVPGGRL